MGISVVIVESPAKAKTLGKYLGKDFEVKASMGHIADLPGGELGIDIEKDFRPTYEVLPDRKKVLAELRRAVKGADRVYLAPDPDREGEAIAFHLKDRLRISEDKVFRVAFNEITKNAVLEAFQHPGKIDAARVNAQQARRILDRLVGYKLSPLLWEKVTRGLSAGRVQSVAVRLIAEREKEIEAFKPDEYWKAAVDLAGRDASGTFTAELRKIAGKPARIANEKEAADVRRGLEAARFAVARVEERERADAPKPPFHTSSLQQQGSIRLRFRAKRTMMIAQQLYEGIEIGAEGPVGLITYMRTDSFRIADEALAACRAHIESACGKEWLSPKPNVYASPKGAQAAHEAVRPTDVNRTPEAMKSFLTRDQQKLYQMIWERFVASQMAPARVAVTEISVEGGDYLLQARGRRVLFPGFTRIWKESGAPGGSAEDKILPAVAQGETLDTRKVDLSRHFTQPPPRFTEATLVKTLEKLGIGRPSTYAPILSTIQERGYVRLTERKFFATDIGKAVTDLLVGSFPKILDVDFTSKMEEDLDKIEEEKSDWVNILRNFYKVFEKDLARAHKEMPDLKKNPARSDKTCPVCGGCLVYRYNRFGRFLGCEKYPACRTTVSVDAKGEAVVPHETEYKCQVCGKPMMFRTGRRGPFLGCSGYPDCRNTLSVDAEGRPVTPEPGQETCEKCGKPMVVKRGRRGPFIACSGYPDCKNAKPLRRKKKSEEESAPEGAPVEDTEAPEGEGPEENG
jgi:DNA topoisomerase I